MTDSDVLPGTQTLRVTREAGVARLVLHRPDALNAFDDELSRGLLATLEELRDDEDVRAVLITGSGRAFSAGADVKSEFTPEGRNRIAQGMEDITNPTILALRTLPKPVIAAVNGPAAGVGCSIAIACDLVVAAESSYFLLAFANIGLTPDGGATMTVPARVGLGRAFVMALLAERLPAREALAWGLVDRVVPDAELAPTTDEIARRLAAGPTRSYAATKEAINASMLARLPEQLALEARLQGELGRSDDFAEGVQAFAAKRAPAFQGR